MPARYRASRAQQVSVEILGIDNVEGTPTAIWTRLFFEEAVSRLQVRYAYATTKGFEAKNIDKSGTGRRAIGVKLSKSLPGLYWLNFFGPEYVQLFGRDRVLEPASDAGQPVGSGLMIAVGHDLEDWSSEPYCRRESEILESLGREYFFSRDAPDRSTVAPAFSKQVS
jgi:hypothetical protein